MTVRYARLRPLETSEQENICIALLRFFSILGGDEVRTQLGKPFTGGTKYPLSVADFFSYQHNLMHNDIWPASHLIIELIQLLARNQFLSTAGGVGFQECFWTRKELTNNQQRGPLWLGTCLGAQFIADKVKVEIACITGVDENGDCAAGTGVTVGPNSVLTCAHVLRDMRIDGQIVIDNSPYDVQDTYFHDREDVGIIRIKHERQRRLPDLSFRESRLLERIVVAGYPSVPQSLEPIMTFQTGEIFGKVGKTIDGCGVELFSAIARPGNSGGPVVGLDGQILGIVTRSLERARETADTMPNFPFFAMVPSVQIAKAVSQLPKAETIIPWEDYS